MPLQIGEPAWDRWMFPYRHLALGSLSLMSAPDWDGRATPELSYHRGG
jgi:hypothetical protein